MGLEKMGLGGVLIFEANQAIGAMGQAGAASAVLTQAQDRIPPVAARAGDAVDGLGRKAAAGAAHTDGAAQSISNAIGKIGGIASSLGLALAPLAGAFGFGIKEAVDFEKQMSAVGAVSLASEKDMGTLTAKAKELGVVTTFSATSAAQAMENLARAGATVPEIMGGIKGVLDAAAAGGLDLATSADIVAKTVRGMGLEFNQASRVADVLAMASSKSNTDMTSLGEAFKYASANARFMKIDLETTATMLGLVADAGLKGSVGGTSFAAMLKKLAKPSETANAWLKANHIEMSKTAEGGLDVVDVTKQLVSAMDKETDVMKKAALAQELFGDRGLKAFSAFDAAVKSGKIDTLFKQLEGAEGTADVMAKRRLDNLAGATTLLTSSLQVFAIETFGAFMKPMATTITQITDGLNTVILVMQKLNAGETDTAALNKEFGSTYVAVAKGIKEGIDTVIEVIHELKTTVTDMITSVTGTASPEMAKMIAKWVTMFVVVGAMVAPILLAVGGLIMFITSVVIPVIEGVGAVIGALTSGPVALLAVAAIAAFGIFRNQGESVGDTFNRVFNGISDLFNWVVDNAIMPFADTFTQTIIPYVNMAWEHIRSFLYNIREYVAQVVGGIILAFKFLAPFFKGLFSIIGTIFGWFFNLVVSGFTLILEVLKPVFQMIKEIAMWLIEAVVNSILLVVQGLVKLADAVGKSDWVSPAFREFANQGKFSLQNQVASSEFNAIGQPTVAEKEKSDMNAKQLAAAKSKKEGGKQKPGAVDVNVALEDNRKLDVSTCTKIDGREVALANGRAQQEVYERNGFKSTPWQRRSIAENGAVPVGGLGGH